MGTTVMREGNRCRFGVICVFSMAGDLDALKISSLDTFPGSTTFDCGMSSLIMPPSLTMI